MLRDCLISWSRDDLPQFLLLRIGKFLNFKMVVNNSETLLSKCAQFRGEEQFIDARLKVGVGMLGFYECR